MILLTYVASSTTVQMFFLASEIRQIYVWNNLLICNETTTKNATFCLFKRKKRRKFRTHVVVPFIPPSSAFKIMNANTFYTFCKYNPQRKIC